MESFWRNSGRSVKFFIFDGIAAIFILLLLFFSSVKMLLFCVIGLTFLFILNYLGFTIPNAIRKVRSSLCGRTKQAVPLKRMSRTDR